MPLLGLCVWLAAVGMGFRALWRHAFTPGPTAAVVQRWPANMFRITSRPTLVMLIHAECGCSNASLDELARIMARSEVPLDVRIFFTPVDGNPDPVDGPLWQRASSLPGVALEVDASGQIVSEFGALVSGQTMLFDRDGVLLFSGGITPSRAHSGDNDGAAAILTALRSGRSPIPTTPVFGCLLRGALS